MVDAAIYKDSGQGLVIISVPYALERKRKTETNTPRPGPKHAASTLKVIDQFFELSPLFPTVGERVFIYGLERGELPSFSIREGRIRRVGTGRGLTLRAYIDVISKDVYCGSPVINESKVVIGMVSGNNLLGETEMFTSTDISDLVAQSGLKK